MGNTCSQAQATDAIKKTNSQKSNGRVANGQTVQRMGCDEAMPVVVTLQMDKNFVNNANAQGDAIVNEAKQGKAENGDAVLHTAFNVSEIEIWPPERFKMVNKVEDARRNQGQVHLCWDLREKRHVAVKQMPNTWIGRSHVDFVAMHPDETEFPWQDVGCIRRLNSKGYTFACVLYGVFKDDHSTYVVTSFASKGDLFTWCGSPVSQKLKAGLDRENFLRPLIMQLLLSVQQLHELNIVHRDISMENFVVSEVDDGSLRLNIIDFGMASTIRRLQNVVRGKSMYVAPELHEDHICDFFISDAFSVGVTIYAVCLQEYPWNFTKPGACKRWEYVNKYGFRSYTKKRKVRNCTGCVTDHMSEGLLSVLEGLLEPDPSKRLTLGEATWSTEGLGYPRRSVWQEEWLKGHAEALARYTSKH